MQRGADLLVSSQIDLSMDCATSIRNCVDVDVWMCNNIAHELILDRTSSLLFKIDTFMILEHITSDLLETPEHIFMYALIFVFLL